MRTFIALELPVEFADSIAAMSRSLSSVLEGRFLDRRTYHLTLAFIGEINDTDVSRAMSAMDDACNGISPITLSPDGIGKFGRSSDATLWMGIAKNPELEQLATNVREQLRLAGIEFDAKAFRPHITLARRVNIPNTKLPDLAFPLPEEASKVTLFKSTLSRTGAEYKPLYTVTL